MQAVSSDGKLSSWLLITQSIVQGSDIHPILYIIFVPDLELLSAISFLQKYAVDKTLKVLENNDVCLEEKFRHIVLWSVQNKLIIYLTKN